jgi:two-component system OmpR family response regulator
MKVLLVEDDLDIVREIMTALAGAYVFEHALDGRQGLEKALLNDYGIIILGLGLPGLGGLEVCQKLRSRDVVTPIIILTGAVEDVEAMISGLDAGADDYLVTPFNAQELSARIRALLRRNFPEVRDDTVLVGDLHISLSRREVRRSGQLISLRRKEFDLLEYLARNPDRVLTRQMILDNVWDSDVNVFTNTVDVHIKYLRDKIDRPYAKKIIKTVHGLGYKLQT